jgi:predicted DNA-binding ribbon-helix-helix protein
VGKQIVTSIKIDEDTWKKAKIEAIRRGMTVAQLLNSALEEALKKSK